jgi:hypothetical protein
MDRPWLEGAERELLALASVSLDTGMGGIWVYAGTEIGLTRVPDCFCRWQDIRPGNAMDAMVAGEAPPEAKPLPAGQPVRSLAVSPARPELIHAALPSGIWRSANAGVTWGRARDADALSVAAVVGGDYESDMPGFGDLLSDGEILAVLAFIKSTWPEGQRVYQTQIAKQSAQGGGSDRVSACGSTIRTSCRG